MFNDLFMPLKGHFHLECLDKDNKVIDSYDEHNMIMTNARKSMSEIFANLSGIKFAHKLVLGTMGCKDGNIFAPKDDIDGFTKSRDRLFSVPSSIIHNVGDMLPNILKGDIITLQGKKEGVNDYYEYRGVDETNFVLSNEALASDKFKQLDGKPYTYEVSFELPRFNTEIPSTLYNTNKDSLDQIGVVQKDTSVIFTFIIDMESANGQYIDDPKYPDPCSVFNEACIVVNDRIFCMKTFNSKIKDDSVKLKIQWTITF